MNDLRKADTIEVSNNIFDITGDKEMSKIYTEF